MTSQRRRYNRSLLGSSLRRLSGAAAILVGSLLLVTCSDTPLAPHRPGLATVAVATSFPSANLSGFNLALDHVRLIVVHAGPPADTLVNTLDAFSPTSTQIQLDATIELNQPAETLQVSLEYLSGSVLLFTQSGSAVVRQGPPGTSPPATLPPPVYVGPGNNIATLKLSPSDTTLTAGAVFPFSVTAADSQGNPVTAFYVDWTSSSSASPIDATGTLHVQAARGSFELRVKTPTGVTDSTLVKIVPGPAAMVKVSGDAQTGAAGKALPLPLVVQVNGSDNLGVPGVAVTFAPLSGGAVDTASVVTDSLGRASTGVVLGPSTGAQSFKATAGPLSVTFTATGSASAPKTWTGASSTDWATGSNWSPAGVPVITDSVIIPSGTANSPLLHGGAFDVGGLDIQAGARLTLDTASLLVNGSLTQAGTFVDPSASSALVLQGTGKTLTGSIPILATTVSGSYTLSGTVTAATLEVVGSLTLGGHTLRTTSAFATAGTGVLTMTTATDSLIVQGAAAFGGGVETGHLTAGTFLLSGSFAVTVHSGFDVGPGLLTVFNGSATQTVVVFDSTQSNQFGSVEFHNGSNVVLGQLTGINGNAKLDSNAVVTSTDTTYTGGGMAMNGGLTTSPGSLLKVGEAWVNTTFNVASGTYAATSTVFTGNGQTVPTGITFPFLYCNGANVSVGPGVVVGTQFAVQAGTTTLSGNWSVPANTFVQFTGKFVLGGHAFSTGGDLTINQGGLLQMTSAADSLLVFGNAYFEGGNESGLMSAGLTIFFNSFTEGSGDPQAYAASGSHIDVFVGSGTETITFGHPGAAGASHFQGFAVDNAQGALQIASDVYLMGPYAYVTGVPRIVHGGGQVVHYANLGITNVTFDNVKIAYDAALGGNNAISLDSVTFENYDVNSATPLIDITSPGNTASPGTPFLFDNMTFGTDITSAGGSGTYLRVTDSNSSDGNVLTIDINSGLVVTEGEAHTLLLGGAVVNWAQP